MNNFYGGKINGYHKGTNKEVINDVNGYSDKKINDEE